jgi:hypothetical protein
MRLFSNIGHTAEFSSIGRVTSRIASAAALRLPANGSLAFVRGPLKNRRKSRTLQVEKRGVRRFVVECRARFCSSPFA